MEKAFAVFDSKMGMYLPPFFTRAAGAAVRSFQEAANKADHPFCKNPEDFTLFEIGSYDDTKGQLIPLEAKIALGCAIDFKNT